MVNTRARQEFINTIEASPQAVKTHDRSAWLAIFAKHNMVEDPVGSRAHQSGGFDSRSGRRSTDTLERFYDTYIAPNDIVFAVQRDIVCGYHVVRDLHLEISMSDKVTIEVPMHLIYELVDQEGELKISRLAAHWELWPMIKQLFGKGLASLRILNSLGIRMLSIQGVGGVIGFVRGLRGIGSPGKEAINAFSHALNSKQLSAMMDLFSPKNQGVEFPHGERSFSPDELIEQVDAKMNVKKLLSAGYTSSCSFDMEYHGEKKQGVAFFEFNAKNKKIDAVRFYWEQ